ncbi:MAG: PqqD family protein [Bacillaceae bacterium]
MKYVQSNKHEIYQLDDDYIIFNTNNYYVFKVNEVGKHCLQLLEQPQSIESLIDQLEKSGDKVTPSDKQQVEEFVRILVEDDLLKEVH